MKIATLVGLLFLGSIANADDASISYGGSPKMLRGHPSVRMVSEKIVIRVTPQTTFFDCTFEFKNEGKACKVRMGFPDRGEGAEATEHDIAKYEAQEKHKSPPVFETLKNFRTFVDGKSVPSKLVRDGSGPSSWHAKEVSFKANQTRIIHDTYEIRGSGGLTNGSRSINECHYIMSTGASWKGSIGKAVVTVHFTDDALGGKLSPITVKSLKVKSPYSYKGWSRLPKGTVAYRGFSKPTVTGGALVFKATNLNPKDKDDIRLYFADYKPQGK